MKISNKSDTKYILFIFNSFYQINGAICYSLHGKHIIYKPCLCMTM